MPKRRKSAVVRFCEKVDTSNPNGCWEWTSVRHKRGYGVFLYERRKVRASRFAWQLAFGPVPASMGVLHKCDNPPCCNPSHLFLGTQLTNVRDMTVKGRRVNHVGENHGFAKLTNEMVAEIRLLLPTGIGQTELGRRFGVGPTTIDDIKRGKTWKHLL